MCFKCEWQEWQQRLEDMLDDSDYEFSWDTLGGIYEWVKKNGHITDKQKQAVENIENSVEGREE